MFNDFFISLLLTGSLSATPQTAPYWSNTGQYDVLARSTGASGLLQMGMGYNESKTFQWHWGASLGVRTDCYSKAQFLPDEAYAGIKWKCITLDFGFKRRDRDFLALGKDLGSISTTSGNIVWSANTRTIPGYTLEVHPWAIPGLDGRLRLMVRFGDYWTLDNRYTKNALIHNSGFGISGDVTDWWTITLALDHYALWGGTHPTLGKLGTSFKNYLQMLIGAAPSGGNYSGGDDLNVLGNQLGRKLIRFDFKGEKWNIVFQHDSPYEDKSGLKFQNFPDGVNTLCFSFDDKDRWVSAILYEFQYTKWQGGTCERRPATEEEIKAGTDPRLFKESDGSWSLITGGMDNYFNNYEYQSGWTYGGRTLGNPLFFMDGTLYGTYNPENICLGVENNRLIANHIGLTGMLFHKLPYRLMLTWSVNYGLYSSDSYTGVRAKLMEWNDIKQTPLHQFSSGFQCEVPLAHNRLRLIPGIFWDKGQVLKDCFAATLGLRYTFLK